MAERLSERLMWWVFFAAGGLGIILYTALVAVVIWGILAGAPTPAGR